MTGIIDRAYPVFDLLDAGMAPFLPAWLRVVVLGALSGAVTMALYTALSDQQAIKAGKARVAEIQGQLKAARDDLALTMRLTRANLAASFGILGRVLLPALLSSLPVLIVIGWLATHLTYAEPPPGTAVGVSFEPAQGAVDLAPPGTLRRDAAGSHLVWPAPATELRLASGTDLLWQGPPDRLASTGEVATPRWWNLFLGNPAGYLPEGAPLERMAVDLPGRDLLGIGPGWMRGWVFVYFATVLVVSLAIKVGFRIA